MKAKRKPSLLLLGDPAVDEFLLVEPANGEAADKRWSNYPSWERWTQDGGVKMMSDYLTKFEVNGLELAVPDKPDKCVVSLSHIKAVDDEGAFSNSQKHNHHTKYRVSRFDGYRMTRGTYSNLLKPDFAEEDYSIVALSDAGGHLRSEVNLWKSILEQKNPPDLLFLKRHLPLVDSDPLWKNIGKNTEIPSVLLVSADDLRAEGVRISRGLSWEVVCEELLNSLKTGDAILTDLASAFGYVIILFDVEGAVLISHDNDQGHYKLNMIVDASSAEGDVEKQLTGTTHGKMNFFSAKFLSIIQKKRKFDASTILEGMSLTLPYLQGYSKLCFRSPKGESRELVLDVGSTEPSGTFVSLRVTTQTEVVYPLFVTEKSLESIAENIVIEGAKAIEEVPSAKFRHFVTVDRHEIDSFRAIDRLVQNYLSSPQVATPISIAVFGAPGSGKSFGVKQLVDKNISPTKTFNLSEAEVSDLPGFFHEIRTEVLKGKTPLCFFDEFDAHDCRLLSSFLAPMQDGEFREGARVHPTGRGIFVFAGGTSTSFEEFYERAKKDQTESDNDGKKLMDFISRLSGYINIKGPNRPVGLDGNEIVDPYYVLRRAILLRVMLEEHLPSIIDKKTKVANIDHRIVRSFLLVDKYKHGARSIEKIITMCAQGNQIDRLSLSDLPEYSQLNLHVETDDFFIN